MKISEVIKALEDSKETYGDIPVNMSTSNHGEGKGNEVIIHEQLFFRYEQFPDGHDELSISDFPY